MNKTIFILGMLIVFAFAPVDIEIAKADVDIIGQCVDIASQIGVDDKTPNDICKAAGYYGCASVIGWYQVCHNIGCGGGCCGISKSLTCSTSFTQLGCPGARQSVQFNNTLICRDTAHWGDHGNPKGVITNIRQAIMNIINWTLGFASLIAVLVIIWGGVNYLTSAGDEDKASNGKKIIGYALTGLVIVGIAYAIVNVIATVIL